MSLPIEQQEVMQNCSPPLVRQVYTRYKPVDDLLNQVHDEWKKLGILLWVDGDQIEESVLSEKDFLTVLQSALQMALTAVQASQSGARRSVHLRTMRAQHREFLRLIYTSDSDQTIQDEHFQKIQTILEKRDGYLKLVNQEQDNMLLIAISTQE